MDDAKKQLVDKLQTANNVLVTVSRDPSVDQLAACLGLALLLNKQGKHTAAVFSGQVPSTLEFLQPEETLEKNTDSLRDFIIALDKSKADKLRYKVEDNVVRIFITPYRTSIGPDDLEFSQGDFNVDLVITLGVSRQEDLDEAIVAHGRILHDATVASITLSPEGGLGSINWQDPQASSLCELVTDLSQEVDKALMDGQIATALLTGIVSETDRFRNDKTTSKAMSASAVLMAAGANQQLVASKLEEPVEPPASPEDDLQDPGEPDSDPGIITRDDGTIEISHDHDEPAAEPPADSPISLPPPDDSPEPYGESDTSAPDNVQASNDSEAVDESSPAVVEMPAAAAPEKAADGPKLMTGPPSLGGTLTANSQPAALDPATDPFSLPASEPPKLLDRKPVANDFTPPPADWSSPPPAPQPGLETQPSDAGSGQTLSDIEAEVKSSEEQAGQEAPELDNARDEVSRALSTAEATLPPKPIEALNAQPIAENINSQPPVPPQPHQDAHLGPTLEDILKPSQPEPESSSGAKVNNPSAPPPVPPPISFPVNNPNPPQQ